MNNNQEVHAFTVSVIYKKYNKFKIKNIIHWVRNKLNWHYKVRGLKEIDFELRDENGNPIPFEMIKEIEPGDMK